MTAAIQQQHQHQQQQQHQHQHHQQQQQHLLQNSLRGDTGSAMLGLAPSLQTLLAQQHALASLAQRHYINTHQTSAIDQSVLREQLQINTLQQAQLIQQQHTSRMANGENKQFAAQLEQLKLQQQSIVAQMHQQQYLLNQTLSGSMSNSEMQTLWNNAQQMGQKYAMPAYYNSQNIKSENKSPSPVMITNDCCSPHTDKLTSFQLFGHGVCKWPDCDTSCSDQSSFIKHMNTIHQVNTDSIKQAKLQQEVVKQLEMQFNKEKERLEGMLQHMKISEEEMSNTDALSSRLNRDDIDSFPSKQHPIDVEDNNSVRNPLTVETNLSQSLSTSIPVNLPVSLPGLQAALPSSLTSLPHALNFMPLFQPAPPMPPMSAFSAPPLNDGKNSLTPPLLPNNDTTNGNLKRRLASDKCSIPISSEIARNAEFYQTTDVRPPFTYASLIRQAIIDSQDRQLTLNEVYQWFISTFAFFRKNQATWKNAVRHNLSLHKCFMRVENVKGAVWTVDENEFYKRRPLKSSNSPTSTPTSTNGSFPSSFGDTITAASLQAAISKPFLADRILDMAAVLNQKLPEDLSMSRNSSPKLVKTEPKTVYHPWTDKGEQYADYQSDDEIMPEICVKLEFPPPSLLDIQLQCDNSPPSPCPPPPPSAPGQQQPTNEDATAALTPPTSQSPPTLRESSSSPPQFRYCNGDSTQMLASPNSPISETTTSLNSSPVLRQPIFVGSDSP